MEWSAGHSLGQERRGLEFNLITGRDGDGLLGPGVLPHSGGRELALKGAEAGDGNLVALLHCLRNQLEGGGDDFLCLGLGNGSLAHVLPNLFDELALLHVGHPFMYVIFRIDAYNPIQL